MKSLLKIIIIGLVITLMFNSCGNADKLGNETTEAASSTLIPPSTDDSIKENDDTGSFKGYYSFETENGTQLAPVLDIQGTFVHTELTTSKIYNVLSKIKSEGYTRVYIVVPGDGYPVFSAAWNTAPSRPFLENNIKVLGDDPIKFYVKYAHKIGLETVAIYKTYEGGGGITVPEGQEADRCRVYEDVPGGRRVYFDSFIQKNLDKRLKRRDSAHTDSIGKKVTSIEAVYMIDSISEQTRLGKTNVYPATSAAYIGKPTPELWISSDNYTYTKFDGKFNCEWKEETRDIYDSNGYLVAENKKVYVLRVSSFDLPENIKYYALAFSDADKEKLLTLPFSMINLYSGNEKLTTSVAAYVRGLFDRNDNPGEHVWGDEISPYFAWQYDYDFCVANFSKWGFEFGYGGDGATACGWIKGNVFCATVGKPQYLPGVLCEGYKEVREHWLNYVKFLSDDCGFDYVQIRMLSHSGFVSDVVNYGFNKPIQDRYYELYGVNILDENVEITKEVFTNIAKIRGEFFMMFVKDAEKYLHANDKKLFVEMLPAYADESLQSVFTYDLNQICSPYQPRILPDWKECVELADEIVLKNYYYNIYKESTGKNIKDYADSLDKKVWIHMYFGYGDATERFARMADMDDKVDGILLYEYNNQRQAEKYGPIAKALGCQRVKKNK